MCTREIYIPHPFVLYDDVRQRYIRAGSTYDSLDTRTGHVRLDLARCRNYEISSTCRGFPDMAEMRIASWMRNEHEKEERAKGLRAGDAADRRRESSDREVDLGYEEKDVLTGLPRVP